MESLFSLDCHGVWQDPNATQTQVAGAVVFINTQQQADNKLRKFTVLAVEQKLILKWQVPRQVSNSRLLCGRRNGLPLDQGGQAGLKKISRFDNRRAGSDADKSRGSNSRIVRNRQRNDEPAGQGKTGAVKHHTATGRRRSENCRRELWFKIKVLS